MDVSQPNDKSREDSGRDELGSLLDALITTGLLYVRKDLDDLDQKQRMELLHDVYGPGDLELRLANLHLVLPLLHKARSRDERQFLMRVFLPWVGIRRRLRVNRNRILDEFAKSGTIAPTTPDEYAHLVNVYRSIIADLIDPYLTLLVACYQFVEGGFTSIEDANFSQGERNKDEYLTSRIKDDDPQVRLLSGYSPIVRNAVAHSGSHGVTYQTGKVAALAPSMLTASRASPASFSLTTMSFVSKGVALGVSETLTPTERAWPINSKRSGRLIGSPPVNTKTGTFKAAIWSIRRLPSSVLSSMGSRSGWADARQCTQARSQA
jgi:hypothetical protein